MTPKNYSNMKSNISSASGFSFGRFAAYFRLYVMANRRKLLLAMGQIFIITFIFYIFNLYFGGRDHYATIAEMGGIKDFDPMWSSCNSIMLMLAFVISALAGSWMYSSVSSKHTRLMTFEIPAAQSEKFLTWWIIYVPLFIVALFVCYYLADVMRVLWVMVGTDYGDQAHIMPIGDLLRFTYPDPINTVPQLENQGLLLVSLYGWLIMLNAVFSLGSIFFHKLGFLKTMAFLFVAMIVFGIISQLGFSVFFSGDNIDLTSRLDSDSPSKIWIVGTTLAVLSAYIYWLGYARYKDTEIVNRW